MNNLVSFWLAPLTAFFHPRVYRDAARGSGGRGVLYVLYLSLIAVALVTVLLGVKVSPVMDSLAGWMQQNMPVVIWTPEGVSLENGQTTASLDHPEYGPLAKLDLTKTEVTEVDMGDVFFFVTAKRVFIKRGPGQIENRDITGAGFRTGQQLPPKVRITGEIVGKLYQNIKATMSVVVPVTLCIFLFISILIMNGLYSLIGLLFNRGRKQKFGYGTIFSMTCFATTAAFMLPWLRIVIPVPVLPWPIVESVLITLAYMFFAFKVTDQAAAE
ncbi:MAG: DUF1189 domain-containing protein [Candidatus Omnitrophica bacterium]|nr:DUF1189 domain-containing protein [Candidatus Omnitrophota bacterium]